MMTKKEVHVVIGSLFGDEGKGYTVQSLVYKSIQEGKKPCVVRFSGGPQAGHCVRNNGKTHICSSYGSGVLLGAPTFILGNLNTYIDPISMGLERLVLGREVGILVKDLPRIDKNKPPYIITPFDVYSEIEDKKILDDGTCGKGLYTCFLRYREDDTDPTVSSSDFYEIAKLYYGETEDPYKTTFIGYLDELKKNSISFEDFIYPFDVVIFEGSQGLLLDEDAGFLPHVTSSCTGLGGLATNKLLPGANIWFVTRTYLTRHGNGYCPIYDDLFYTKYFHKLMAGEINKGNKFQGDFKMGYLEEQLFRMAYVKNSLEYFKKKFNLRYSLVVTHSDCLKSSVVPIINRDTGKIDERRVEDLGDIFLGKSLDNIFISKDEQDRSIK